MDDQLNTAEQNKLNTLLSSESLNRVSGLTDWIKKLSVQNKKIIINTPVDDVILLFKNKDSNSEDVNRYLNPNTEPHLRSEILKFLKENSNVNDDSVGESKTNEGEIRMDEVKDEKITSGTIIVKINSLNESARQMNTTIEEDIKSVEAAYDIIIQFYKHKESTKRTDLENLKNTLSRKYEIVQELNTENDKVEEQIANLKDKLKNSQITDDQLPKEYQYLNDLIVQQLDLKEQIYTAQIESNTLREKIETYDSQLKKIHGELLKLEKTFNSTKNNLDEHVNERKRKIQDIMNEDGFDDYYNSLNEQSKETMSTFKKRKIEQTGGKTSTKKNKHTKRQTPKKKHNKKHSRSQKKKQSPYHHYNRRGRRITSKSSKSK